MTTTPISSQYTFEFCSPSLRQRLLQHPIYSQVTTLADVRIFMREHAFAVWDFMTLVKRLQAEVTCTRLPWVPVSDPQSARLINEIVLAEESDADGDGSFASHFDLYRLAMQDVGADLTPIDSFVARIAEGQSAARTVDGLEIADTTREFVNFTLQMAAEGKPHEVAAAFCYGREDIIPGMFERLLPSLDTGHSSLKRFRYYLDRHIEVDGDTHGPMAHQLVANLCGEAPAARHEARVAADRAIRSRIALWDGSHTLLLQQRRGPR